MNSIARKALLVVAAAAATASATGCAANRFDPNDNDQLSPAISGSRVVWEDSRNSETNGTDVYSGTPAPRQNRSSPEGPASRISPRSPTATRLDRRWPPPGEGLDRAFSEPTARPTRRIPPCAARSSSGSTPPTTRTSTPRISPEAPRSPWPPRWRWRPPGLRCRTGRLHVGAHRTVGGHPALRHRQRPDEGGLRPALERVAARDLRRPGRMASVAEQAGHHRVSRSSARTSIRARTSWSQTGPTIRRRRRSRARWWPGRTSGAARGRSGGETRLDDRAGRDPNLHGIQQEPALVGAGSPSKATLRAPGTPTWPYYRSSSDKGIANRGSDDQALPDGGTCGACRRRRGSREVRATRLWAAVSRAVFNCRQGTLTLRFSGI